MIRPDAGRVLRRALLAWGLGHLALGLTTPGRALLAAEVAVIALVAWLATGLANTSAYLVPFLAGVLFLVAWGWQAVDAYRLARAADPVEPQPTAPGRSEAVAIGWLAVPVLVWGAGFWLAGAQASTPAAALDRFVSEWTADGLDRASWSPALIREADAAAARLPEGEDRFQDVRVRIVAEDDRSATAVAESVRYEQRRTRFLGLFPGSELVPVTDDAILRLELAAEDAPLPGGGGIGAVRWSVVDADAAP